MIELFLLFTVLPATELWLLFQLGEIIGVFETVWLLLLTGVIGVTMARWQGSTVLKEMLEGAQSGQAPGPKVLEGVLILLGGLLLITPGAITDVIGLLLIFPLSRKLMAPFIQQRLLKRLNIQSMDTPGSGIHMGPIGAGPGLGGNIEIPDKTEADEHLEAELPPDPETTSSLFDEEWDHPVVD